MCSKDEDLNYDVLSARFISYCEARKQNLKRQLSASADSQPVPAVRLRMASSRGEASASTDNEGGASLDCDGAAGPTDSAVDGAASQPAIFYSDLNGHK